MEVLGNAPFLPLPHLFFDEYYDYLTLVVEEELTLGLLGCEEGETVVFHTSIEAVDWVGDAFCGVFEVS